MKIYVFKRKDGSYWAEYSEKCARRQGEIINVLEASSRSDYEYLVLDGYQYASDRVKALADRGLDEYLVSIKTFFPASVQTAVYVVQKPKPAPPAARPWWQLGAIFGR